MKQSQYNPVPSVYGHHTVQGTFVPPKLHRNTLHFTPKQNHLHINHVSSLHITSLIYSQTPLAVSPLLVTAFLTLFLNVFSLQGNPEILGVTPVAFPVPLFPRHVICGLVRDRTRVSAVRIRRKLEIYHVDIQVLP